MLPSGPGDSRAEFGPSRERSKQLTRVPTGGVATPSFSRSYNGDETIEPTWRKGDARAVADGPCTMDHERPKEPRAKRAHGEGIGECTARVRTETVDNRYNIPDAVGVQYT